MIEGIPALVKVNVPIIQNPFEIFDDRHFGKASVGNEDQITFKGKLSFSGSDNSLNTKNIVRYFLGLENVVVFINSIEKYISNFSRNLKDCLMPDFFSSIISPYFLLKKEELDWILIEDNWKDQYLKWMYES